jgi:3-hydroxyisobutyrate dehydrogenase
MADADTVAVLGAGGTMGLGMARNLARAGFSVRAWNRSSEKAQPLADDGAVIADSPAEAIAGARIVVTMLADGDAVLAAMGGAEGALAGEREDDLVWVQMSTLGEDGTERCAALAEEAEVTFVDAPVLGTKEPAEQGELVVMASGPDEVRERVDPVFDAVGKKTMWVGEAGAGSRLKLATNSWIVSVVEGTAETLAFAEGLGLDPQLVLDAVSEGPLDLPYLQLKGASMIKRSFEPSFRLALATKDARLVDESARRRELDLPMLAAIRRRFEEAAADHGDEDLSAVFLASAPAERSR